MAFDPEDPAHQAVLYVEDRLNSAVDRFHKTLRPIWRIFKEVTQTVIWLSGGALVLSITLTQVFLDQGSPVKWGILLPIAWVLLATTVVLSLLKMSKLMGVRSAPFQFEGKKKELRLYVRKVRNEPNASDLIDEKIEELWKDAWETPTDAIRHHDLYAKVGGSTFLLGLLALVLFAILNVPGI